MTLEKLLSILNILSRYDNPRISSDGKELVVHIHPETIYNGDLLELYNLGAYARDYEILIPFP